MIFGENRPKQPNFAIFLEIFMKKKTYFAKKNFSKVLQYFEFYPIF